MHSVDSSIEEVKMKKTCLMASRNVINQISKSLTNIFSYSYLEVWWLLKVSAQFHNCNGNSTVQTQNENQNPWKVKKILLTTHLKEKKKQILKDLLPPSIIKRQGHFHPTSFLLCCQFSGGRTDPVFF